jgi:hypothetical protein
MRRFSLAIESVLGATVLQVSTPAARKGSDAGLSAVLASGG